MTARQKLLTLLVIVLFLFTQALPVLADRPMAPRHTSSIYHDGSAAYAVAPGAYLGGRTLLSLPATAHPTAYPDLVGLPSAVDLSPWDMPVGDQAFVGSCAAWATTYSLVGWYANRYHLPGAPFAPMLSYHDAGGGIDNGSFPSANLDVDQLIGLLPMGFTPAGNYDYASAPTTRDLAIARHYRVTGSYPVWTSMIGAASGLYDTPGALTARSAIEASLAQGIPVVLSLPVYTNFDNADQAHPYVATPGKSDVLLGYHAVMAMSYDQYGLWIENQWSANWGRNGYAELSWSFVNSLVDEADAMLGLHVDRGAPLPAVTAGPARLALSSSVLNSGAEVVVTGYGFKPNEQIFLYHDGRCAGVWNATPWGTFSTEVYHHVHAPVGPHGEPHWATGPHTIRAVGAGADSAQISLEVRN